MAKLSRKNILKFFVVLALLTLFYFYYFRQIFNLFSAKYTNTAKFEEKIEMIEPPAVTICFSPNFKPSVLKSLNITDDMFFNRYPEAFTNKNMNVQYSGELSTQLFQH